MAKYKSRYDILDKSIRELARKIQTDKRHTFTYSWSIDIDDDDYYEKWAEENIYFRYSSYYECDEWWSNWLNDRGRLRDELIDKLLGGRNYPSFYDILPKELKNEI